MNVLTEMVKPIFSRDWDLEKCPEESLVLFFFWNLLIFELEAILGLSMSNQKSNTIQKRETFETFETQTPKNYQYLSEKKPLQSYLEIFSPAYHLSRFPAKTTSWSWKTMEKLMALALKPGIFSGRGECSVRKPKNISQKMPELISFEGFVGILFHTVSMTFFTFFYHE